jgi:hypothetical protein
MGKLSIIEEILFKNHISPSAESYYLKLSMPSQNNSLIIGKFGEQVLIALQDADLVSDPVFSFDYNEGIYLPVQFENKFGKTVCSFLENGNRVAFPYALKRCMLFQAMFAGKIRNQKWLENGVKVE